MKMTKKLLLVVISLVLLIGLQACSTTPMTPPSRQGVVYPEKLASEIKASDAKAVILVNERGALSFFDAAGKPLDECKLPGTEIICKEGSKCEQPPDCNIKLENKSVFRMKALPILENQGSGCMTFGPDANGFHYQICW